MSQPRREKYRSIHSRRWGTIEQAVPRQADVSEAAKQADGLADPNRLALAVLLNESPGVCVSDLAELTGIERSVVSSHLKRLRGAGLSESRREGRLTRHSLTDRGAELVQALMA